MGTPSPSPSYGTQLARLCCYEVANQINSGPKNIKVPNHRSPGPSVNDPEVGDLLLLVMFNDYTGTANLFNPPSGFTYKFWYGSSTSDAHIGVYYRLVDGTEPLYYSIPDQSYYGFAVLMLIKNVDPAQPFHVGGEDWLINGGINVVTLDAPQTTKDYTLDLAITAFDTANAAYYGAGLYVSSQTPEWTLLLSEAEPQYSTSAGVSGAIAYMYPESATTTGPPCRFVAGVADGSASVTFSINSYWPQPGSPSEGTPSEATPSASPSEGTPSEGTPSTSPSEGTPSQGTPSDSPSEGTPSPSDTPSSSPSEGTPSEGTPSEATPSSGTNVTQFHCYTETELSPIGLNEIPVPNNTSLGPYPKNPQNGDLLLLFIGANNYDSASAKIATANIPAGFTVLQNYASTSYDVINCIAYKFIDAKGAPSSYQFSYTDTSAGAFAYLLLISGSTPVSPPQIRQSDSLSQGGGIPISGIVTSYGDLSFLLGVFEGSCNVEGSSNWTKEACTSFKVDEAVTSCIFSHIQDNFPSGSTYNTSLLKDNPGGAYVTTVTVYTEHDAESPSEGTPSEGTPSNTPSEGTPSVTPSDSPSEGTPSSSPSEGTPSEGTVSDSPSEGTPSSSPSIGTPSNTPSASPEILPFSLTTSELDSYDAIDQLLLQGFLDTYSGPPHMQPVPGEGVRIEYGVGFWGVKLDSTSRFLELCLHLDVTNRPLEYEIFDWNIWDRGRSPNDRFSVFVYRDQVKFYTFDLSSTYVGPVLPDGITLEEEKNVWFWTSIAIAEDLQTADFALRVNTNSNRSTARRVITVENLGVNV